MVRHTVYFWLNEEVMEKDKKIFEESLKNLMKQIDKVFKWEIGIPGPTAHRTITDHTFSYSLLAWFKSLADHNDYLAHPEYRVFEDRFRQLWKKVRVYDSTIIGMTLS